MQVFVTRSLRSAQEAILYEHITVTVGRPKVASIIEEEFNNMVGAMHVGACGPKELGSDVRRAIDDLKNQSKIDFEQQEFS